MEKQMNIHVLGSQCNSNEIIKLTVVFCGRTIKWPLQLRFSLPQFSIQRDHAIRFLCLVGACYKLFHSPVYYASELNISTNYLEKICKQLFGKSPVQIINLRLTIEACNMLAMGKLDVKRVGHELGFEDPAYFSRFFKKQTGHSPVAFRQMEVRFDLSGFVQDLSGFVH